LDQEQAVDGLDLVWLGAMLGEPLLGISRVARARMRSRAGYSVYDGWTVQGWPRFVIRRGQIVLADGAS
jgi:hypothetical protein